MDYTWEEYQEFVRDKKTKKETQFGELTMYSFFDTLQWGWRYAIVLKNQIIIMSKEYPYDEWYVAEAVMKIIYGKE